jgi:hypothetical protein
MKEKLDMLKKTIILEQDQPCTFTPTLSTKPKKGKAAKTVVSPSPEVYKQRMLMRIKQQEDEAATMANMKKINSLSEKLLQERLVNRSLFKARRL